jgi:hypothetical protein
LFEYLLDFFLSAMKRLQANQTGISEIDQGFVPLARLNGTT